VDPFSGTAQGMDLGFHYVPDAFPDFAFGLNLQDIVGGSYDLDNADDTVDRTILAGLGYTRHFESGAALRVMMQYDKPERANSKFHVGAEYMFTKYLPLRAGYYDDTPTFGLGVGVSDYGLDYAFYSKSAAGSTQAFSFNARFGSTLDERRTALEEARAQQEKDLLKHAFESRVATQRTK